MNQASTTRRSLLLAPIALLIVVMIAACVGAYWILHRGLPEREGTVSLPVLSAPVTVRWDIWGVPHLEAESSRDLAAALGFVHANDRMLQMEMGRRWVAGRLSEVAGAETLELDIEMRTLRLRRTAERLWQTAGPESRDWLTAYAAGVNAWLDRRGRDLPPEFGILGISPEPWEPADSLGFTLLMGYDLSFWQGRPEEYRFGWLRSHGVEGATDLIGQPNLHLPAEIVDLAVSDTPASSEGDAEAVEGEEGEEGNSTAGAAEAVDGPLGSNSWALGSSRSGEVGAIVANDPHLGFGLPGIWYEVQLRAPDYEVAGMSLPGSPGVVIGQSGTLGWALTNVMLDDHDLFFEQLDKSGRSVRRGDAWLPISVEEEVIEVRGGESHEIQLMETDRGPLLPADGERGLPARSLAWTAYFEADPLAALIGLARAGSIDEVPEAIAGFVGPAQNLVVADAEGGLLRIVLGALPLRRRGDGKLPAPGWDLEYGWDGAADPAGGITESRPESDVLIAANQDLRPPEYDGPLEGDFDLPSRADRIAALLEDRERWRAQEVGMMQLDILSLYADRLIELASDEYRGGAGRAYATLTTWDRRFQTAGPAALFSFFERELANAVFADDVEMKNVSWMQRRHWLIRVLAGEMSEAWFDDASTERQEGRHETIAAALERAWVECLDRWGDDMMLWSYGDLHTLTLRHPLGSLPVIGGWFDRGAFPLGGSASTVMAGGGAWRDGARPISFGPSMRWISVVGDPDRSLAIVPGGQSGHPFDSHYDDQLELYLEGRLRTVSWRPASVESAATSEMRLQPGPVR